MRKLLILGLALVLILSMASTAMAGSAKGNGMKVRAESQVQLEAEDIDVEETEEEGDEAEEPFETEEDEADEEGLPQGAVHCSLTIDYKVPGNGFGTMTLVAVRGAVEVAFEAQIPWGLSDDEAMEFINQAFGVQIQEAFGLEVRSFKVKDINFDEETSVTTATLLVIHGKAPVKLPKTPEAKAAVRGHGKAKNK